MRARFGLLTIAAALTLTGQGWAIDSVKTVKGVLSGRVVEMNSVQVEIQQGAGNAAREGKEVPVNQIITIFFEDEPSLLRSAKMYVVSGHFAKALDTLDRIQDDIPRAEIKQDIEFYKALCAARLAAAGNGKISDAGRAMNAFVEANPNSYHYFEALETVGDLLVAVRQYPQATEYYNRLAKAPWPDYEMRAGVAIGRVLLAQGKNDEALKAFDRVLAISADSELANTQRAMANLGTASCLTIAQKPDEAIALVKGILRQANSDNEQLLARAYNVLGTAQRQKGRIQQAILAFLHVDLMYAGVPDAHAEALANLADLWEQIHKPERAQRARSTLEEQYPDSPWAKKGGV